MQGDKKMAKVKREVSEKNEPEDDEKCADVFGITSDSPKKEEIETDENLLVNPEILKEEKNLKEENDEDYKKEEAKSAKEMADLSKEERYAKLCKLLEHSKFYSDYLMKKMSVDDEKTKEVKEKKLADRRSNGGEASSSKRKRGEKPKKANKKAKVEAREYDGNPIPEEQPILVSGGIMRDYQIEGYKWMANLWENGINGILADEMGLGKTIQTIALFAHLVEMGVPGPFLVVAPLSTIANWCKEFKKFAPKLPTVLYHGSAAEREELRNTHLPKRITIEDVFSEPRTIQNIFVTSYEIAINDRVHFKKVHWKYIVVDEGHRLKNTNCRLIKELKQYTSANRLLLTGTPLQNNLDELWSLLNFLMAEIFDDLRVFKSWFDAKDLDTVGADEQKRILAQERQGNILNTLHQILTPFLLRRVKADVDLKIPPKKEVLVYCPMTDNQTEFYTATINKTIGDMVGSKTAYEQDQEEFGASGAIVHGEVQLMTEEEMNRPKQKRSTAANLNFVDILKDDDNENLSDRKFEKYLESIKELEEQRKMNVASSLGSAYNAKRHSTEISYSMKSRMMDLRKITNHPYLIEYPLTDCGSFYNTDQNVIDKCGKMKVLDQMLNALLERKHKVLIFSQMTRMMDILGDYLSFKGLPYSRLDGTMGYEDRQVNIDNFNETEKVNLFLLSTRAGGLGINLTAADTVIIYDSDWNPQQDLQAQDRCHRIGQTKPVMVYRLVTANTVDQKIVERAAAKRKLEKLIIHSKKFKSQDKAGLTETMSAITPQELLELMNSKDHCGVVDRKDGAIFSKPDLDQLLDRSDLSWAKIQEKENQLQKEQSELFKVVDTEGIQDNLLQSVGEKYQN